MREMKMNKERLIEGVKWRIYEILVVYLEIEGGTLTLDDIDVILQDVSLELYLDYRDDDEEEYDE